MALFSGDVVGRRNDIVSVRQAGIPQRLENAGSEITKIERKISVGSHEDALPGHKQTEGLSGEERVSMLEELRYDLGEIAGYDYSQRFGRIISVAQRSER
jgi:hypothetical protein